MIVILDIETQELVPQDRNLTGLRVSVAGACIDGKPRIFAEHELAALFKILDDAELIVGHNLHGFDYKILSQYAKEDLGSKHKHKTFDILRILVQKTDRLISLNDLAKRNLGVEKLGEGKDAPQLFKDGRISELCAYLEQDLLITHQLFEHIRSNGKLKYGHINYKDPVEREVSIHISER